MKFAFKWTAPEAILSKRFDAKNDVWAFGITMWEIFSLGSTPYKEWDHAKTLRELKTGYRMPMPDYHCFTSGPKGALRKVSYSTLHWFVKCPTLS